MGWGWLGQVGMVLGWVDDGMGGWFRGSGGVGLWSGWWWGGWVIGWGWVVKSVVVLMVGAGLGGVLVGGGVGGV